MKMNVSELEFPIAVFLSEGNVPFRVNDLQELTTTTPVGLRCSRYAGRQLIDSSGLRCNVTGASKVERIAPWWVLLNPCIRIDVQLAPGTQRIALEELKALVLERYNSYLEESGAVYSDEQLEALIHGIRSAESIREVIELLW